MKLDYLQALKRVSDARGAWVLHGQEPLLEQNLMDAFRASWQQREVERQRYDVSSVSDWKNVFNALNSLSLFSTQPAVEVHGNIKPDASSLKLLKSYLQQDSNNLLLVVMPVSGFVRVRAGGCFRQPHVRELVDHLVLQTRRDLKRVAKARGIAHL